MVETSFIAKGGSVIGEVIGKAGEFVGWVTGTLQGRFLLLIVVCGFMIWLYMQGIKEQRRYIQFRRRL